MKVTEAVEDEEGEAEEGELVEEEEGEISDIYWTGNRTSRPGASNGQ